MPTVYKFRKATEADIARAWEIILQAKALMASEGRNQWTEAYPAVSNIEDDISGGNAYVLCIDDVPMVYGAVVFSGEPVYEQLRGSWLSDREHNIPEMNGSGNGRAFRGEDAGNGQAPNTEVDYVVAHRLCVADEARGKGLAQRYFNEVTSLALSNCVYSFRVDTNFDNAAMLHILEILGFTYCGEIFYPQGSRLAFEKILKHYSGLATESINRL